MYSKMLRNLQDQHAALSHAYQNMSRGAKSKVKAVAVGAVLMTPQLAMAQEGGGVAFFCYIAMYFKQIVGGAALVALLMWAIEHIFGVAKLHDVVIKVGIAAAIVIGATTIIAKSGLVAPSCGLM
jgi:asparagine N-glycosylation enzyme membrane subunit Stt3